MRKFILLLLVSLSISIAIGWQSSIAQQSNDAQTASATEQQFKDAAIEHISHGFRDPDDIVIRRLNISSDEAYALASWNYLEIGGMTVLKKDDDDIEVLTHGGGAINQTGLEALDIPTETAIELLRKE